MRATHADHPREPLLKISLANRAHHPQETLSQPQAWRQIGKDEKRSVILFATLRLAEPLVTCRKGGVDL